MSAAGAQPIYSARRALLLTVFGVAALLLVARAVDLQVFRKHFLQDQGNARYLRVVSIPAHRGMILDRNGAPLAISTPVDAVCANPQELLPAHPDLAPLARLLNLDLQTLRRLLASHSDSEFVYIKRQIDPYLAKRAMALNIPGIFLQREYRRYYPTGEVSAQLLGFNNIDDVGQEGVELEYNHWLQGHPGSMRVIKDGYGRIVEDVESIREPRPGKNLVLSIDERIQYIAYRALKAAVLEHDAHSGSVVVLDVRTGEVLAMANQPSFNPNNRRDLIGNRYPNRAETDVFEPGSTVKPFTIACALESGKYRPDTPINTSPGWYVLDGYTISDVADFGLLDVATVISKSSNVGASKIALSLSPRSLWTMFTNVGFGSLTDSGFPGEAAGVLDYYTHWNEAQQATLSFGYGLSVTPLQLADAYVALADGGIKRPVSLLKRNRVAAGRRIIPASIAAEVRTMLEGVISKSGTGYKARVPGYRIAGKTGTVRKLVNGKYSEKHYVAVFAGMAPASHPRLVTVVMVNDPRVGGYYGGTVAAPVFARVMAGALRILDIAPDAVPATKPQFAGPGGDTT